MSKRNHAKKVLDSMPEDDRMLVAVKPITQVPFGFIPIESGPGTAAYPYIVDVGKLRTLADDPQYIGSFIEDYGYLSIFTDGSSVKTEISTPFVRGPVHESFKVKIESNGEPSLHRLPFKPNADYLRSAQVVTPPKPKDDEDDDA
jgi:hypothetical protein